MSRYVTLTPTMDKKHFINQSNRVLLPEYHFLDQSKLAQVFLRFWSMTKLSSKSFHCDPHVTSLHFFRKWGKWALLEFLGRFLRLQKAPLSVLFIWTWPCTTKLSRYFTNWETPGKYQFFSFHFVELSSLTKAWVKTSGLSNYRVSK